MLLLAPQASRDRCVDEDSAAAVIRDTSLERFYLGLEYLPPALAEFELRYKNNKKNIPTEPTGTCHVHGTNISCHPSVPFWFRTREYAQKLRHYMPQIDDAGVEVVGVSMGTVDAARDFCAETGFPLDSMFMVSGFFILTPSCDYPVGSFMQIKKSSVIDSLVQKFRSVFFSR